jgi:hypothetical protein
MLDADTFRGIHARLPELGGVVLDATQKLMKTGLGVTAAELARMYNAPTTLNSNTRAGGPEEGLLRGEGLSSLAPRASIDFFSGLSLERDRQQQMQQQQAAARGGTGNSSARDSTLTNGGCVGVYVLEHRVEVCVRRSVCAVRLPLVTFSRQQYVWAGIVQEALPLQF